MPNTSKIGVDARLAPRRGKRRLNDLGMFCGTEVSGIETVCPMSISEKPPEGLSSTANRRSEGNGQEPDGSDERFWPRLLLDQIAPPQCRTLFLSRLFRSALTLFELQESIANVTILAGADVVLRLVGENFADLLFRLLDPLSIHRMR